MTECKCIEIEQWVAIATRDQKRYLTPFGAADTFLGRYGRRLIFSPLTNGAPDNGLKRIVSFPFALIPE